MEGTPTGDKVQKVICLKAQLTNRLCRVSQFNLSTIGLVMLSRVTKNINRVILPQVNWSRSWPYCVITALDEPLIITNFFRGVRRSRTQCLTA